MKKIVLILAVMLMTAGLYADSITFGPAVDNVGSCTIPYVVVEPNVPPVAMGLNVDCDTGQQIDAVTIVAGDSFFDIFMDAAYDLGGGYNYGDGTPIANQTAPGEVPLPQEDFCISMGGLGGEFTPGPPVPPMSGEIVLTSSGGATGQLSENALRGGVVDVNGNAMTTNLPIPFTITGVVVTDCMEDLGIDVSDPVLYAKFLAAEKPECWCSDRQCKGDADMAFVGKDKAGMRVYVSQNDLDVLIAGWQKNELDPGFSSFICADFNHAFVGKDKAGMRVYVSQNDLDILIANWQKNELEVTSCF